MTVLGRCIALLAEDADPDVSECAKCALRAGTETSVGTPLVLIPPAGVV